MEEIGRSGRCSKMCVTCKSRMHGRGIDGEMKAAFCRSVATTDRRRTPLAQGLLHMTLCEMTVDCARDGTVAVGTFTHGEAVSLVRAMELDRQTMCSGGVRHI